MADGIPCQWCGYMEASHGRYEENLTHAHTMPCDDYKPLDPFLMQEIDLARGLGRLWENVLPKLGTDYRYARRTSCG